MTFRRSSNEVDAWQAFCRKRFDTIESIPRLARAFASADRFDSYLQSGEVDACPSMSSLDDEEWQVLSRFVKSYSEEWQTWFVRSMYVAYFEECDHRSVDFDREPN